MTLDQIINLAALITLVEMMIYIGLTVPMSDVFATVKDWKLVARAMLANFVLVPAVTVCLLLIYHVQPLVALGILVVAVCPGAPYGPVFCKIAKANVGAAAGLMIIMGALSPLLSPAILNWLVAFVARDQTVTIDLARLIITLLLGQVLPLAFGLLVHVFAPQIAAVLSKPAGQLSKILNVALIGLIFYAYWRMMLEVGVGGLIGLLILLACGMLIGWALGWPARERRRMMALTTGVRNTAVGLVIVSSSFAGTAAMAGAVTYGVVGLLGGLAVAMWWRR